MKTLVSIVTTVVTDVKKDIAAIKAFIPKAVTVIEDIATDAKDIMEGKQPPSTGIVAVDDILKVLAILGPYYKNTGNEAALLLELQNVITFLEGAAAVI